MRRSLRFPAGILISALLLLAATAGTSAAATRRFKPAHFTPTNSSASVVRNPLGMGGMSGSASFVAPLGLPAGATITGIRLYSTGISAPRTAGVLHYLIPTATPIATVTSSDDTDLPTAVTGSLVGDPSLRTVDADAIYWVEVETSATTLVWAVDVDYTP